MSMLHWSILLPFIAAICIPFTGKITRKIHTGWFVLAVPIAIFLYLCTLLPKIKEHTTIMESVSWIPSLDISFDAYVDGLGLLFAMLITGIGALVTLYSIFYMNKEKENLVNFYVFLLLFMGAMLGVVLSDNLIVLYTFWEFTSLSSFLLIGYWNDRKASRYGAQKSLLITFLGGLSMLGGFIALYVMGDTFSIRELISMAPELIQHPLFYFSMVLVLLGAFTKSAQFPFHIWLPDAMEAPTPVSAYLHSATMVKAGIYLVARLSPIFALSAEWVWIVGLVGIITLFWGSFNAIRQHDLKGILAFSTISQLGMIMSMLGMGAAALHYTGNDSGIFMAATAAAIFHLINHATFKGSLFMVVGIIDHETGTRDIRKLGGLMTFMPITFTIAAIGSFSMAGLPPFNGFLSKEMFFKSTLTMANADFLSLETWGILFPVIAWIASVFTFVYCMILFFKTFTGKAKLDQLPKKPHEAPIGMLISPIILVSLVIIWGLFPNMLAETIIEPAVAAIQPVLYAADPYHVHISMWHGLQPELWMTIGVVALGFILYKTYPSWTGIYKWLPKRFTLNNGYNKGLSWMDIGSNRLTRGYMNGNIHDYLVYIFGFTFIILLYMMWRVDAFTINTTSVTPIGIYEVILAVILVTASIMILFAKSRLTSIILLGTVGYTVSLLFVLFRAPDLALTQFVIETVSTSLFLLCFYHLPKYKPKEKRVRFKVTNMIIALGVGVTMTLLALSSHSTKLFDSISEYYKQVTYKEAGGENMVNVILVDFRGLDTMFEITVLAIAAIGIYTMIKLRLERKGGAE